MKNSQIVLCFIIVILIAYMAVASAVIYRLEGLRKYDDVLYSQIQKEYTTINEGEKQIVDNLQSLNEYVETCNLNMNVIGKISIEKINVEYPILYETTDELLKIAPTRYCGPTPNGLGNLVIVGHNYYDGTHFSNLNKLKIGDKIVITDITNHSCTYKVYEKEVIKPTDFSFIEQNKNATESMVTLLTCINGLKNRLIIKCKEI